MNRTKKRQKKYNPASKYNPAHQARTLEKIEKQLEPLQRMIKAISKSHDNHITRLANFARHDIKNAIQNMDSILSTKSSGEYDENAIGSLSTSVGVIRNTIDNFAKLVPYSTTGKFTIDTLMVAVELLARADIQKNDIDMVFQYSRTATIQIELPFQAVLQMLNNLVINSIKSLESVDIKKFLILAELDDGYMCVQIRDNGAGIEDKNAEKIFEYGYSTTGGSGIGLFHAKYLCTEFKGEISVDLAVNGCYNKTFIVKLPVTLKQDDKDSSHH